MGSKSVTSQQHPMVFNACWHSALAERVDASYYRIMLQSDLFSHPFALLLLLRYCRIHVYTGTRMSNHSWLYCSKS